MLVKLIRSSSELFSHLVLLSLSLLITAMSDCLLGGSPVLNRVLSILLQLFVSWSSLVAVFVTAMLHRSLGVLVGSGVTLSSIGLLYGMDGTSICGSGLRLFLLGVVSSSLVIRVIRALYECLV